MKGKSSNMLHIRVGDNVKEQASYTLASMGLTVSEAVRIFLAKVITEKAIPFNIQAPRNPNKESVEAILEAKAIINSNKPSFKTAKDLFDDLEKTN